MSAMPRVVPEPLPRRQIYRLPRAQRVADIMMTARAVFSEKGYNDAMIAEIAERAGVVEGTIYRYFSGKRELLIKVVEDWYEEMLTDYDRQLLGIRGTWNRLRFMVWRHLSVIHNDPAMCRLIFNELRSVPEYRETAVFELNREYTNRTLAIVQEAMDSGEFRAGIPLRVVRDMIYGGLVRSGVAIDRGEEAIRRLEEVAERLEKASGQVDHAMHASGVTQEMSRTTGKASCLKR